MAYYIQEALAVVKKTAGLAGINDVGTIAADLAVAAMWRAGAWEVSLGDFDSFNLIPDVQDYPEPLANIPSDILGLWQAELVILNTDGDEQISPLVIDQQLQPLDQQIIPSKISYTKDGSLYRLSGKAPSNYAAPLYFIRGKYKKRHTAITPANVGSAVLPWEDDLLPCFIEVLRWKFLSLAGSDKADAAEQKAARTLDATLREQGFFGNNSQISSSINTGGF